MTDRPTDEARSPKYAQIERERRWLVDLALRPGLSALPFTLIEDRYISGTQVRLRRRTDSSGVQVLKLTKKYEAPNPLARPIVIAYLTADEHTVLASLPARPLAKRRYKVDEHGIVFAIDRFLAPLAPLELAEIEWPDDAGLRALRSPGWAIRDISDDPRYEGGTLSLHGLPEDLPWPTS